MNRTIALACILAFTSPAFAQITNASHFQSILRAARPGETITVAAGTYRLNEVYLDRRKGRGDKNYKVETLKISFGEFGTMIYNPTKNQIVGIKKPLPEKKLCLCGCGKMFRPYSYGQSFLCRQHYHFYKQRISNGGTR